MLQLELHSINYIFCSWLVSSLLSFHTKCGFVAKRLTIRGKRLAATRINISTDITNQAMRCFAFSSSARSRPSSLLTFQPHADLKTLVEPAERTAFPLSPIDPALLVFCAGVPLAVLDGSFEKPLQAATEKVFFF